MIVDAVALGEFATAALTAAGARAEDAEVTAEVLVAADLAGVDSHGVARLCRYVEGLRTGRINPSASPAVVRDNAGVCVVDAGNGLGQPALRFAVDLAVERTAVHGVAAVAVRRSNHIGIAGWYAERAARAGKFAIVTTNATPQVAPVGVGEPMFGTNPISYAVTDVNETLCFDAATSVVPRGKLELLHREGSPMREGWAVGPDGRTVTDLPAVVAGLKARAGYALLPIGGLGVNHGGHKGSGLGLLVELLCGPLTGASWSRHTYGAQGADLGQFVLCLELAALGDPTHVAAGVRDLATEVRQAKRARSDVEVRMPGDRRRRLVRERTTDGIPLLPPVVADLTKIATLTGIPPLDGLDRPS